jgi:hypothetical protein
MVVANTTRGVTHTFDLTNPSSLADLLDLTLSGQITALSILRAGVQHTLTMPCGFRNPTFGAEAVVNGGRGVIGERVFVQAGDTRLSLTATFNGNVVRTDLVRTGVMRYNPLKAR